MHAKEMERKKELSNSREYFNTGNIVYVYLYSNFVLPYHYQHADCAKCPFGVRAIA